MVETTYRLMVTNDGNHWMWIGKELKSKKLVLSALKKTAYPPDYSKYVEIKWLKNVKTVITTEENFDENE